MVAVAERKHEFFHNMPSPFGKIQLVEKKGPQIWFTSDTHFGHKNVIPYCNRPFADVDNMNRELVRRWNLMVKPDDIIYHLGDIAMGPKVEWEAIFAQLNGNKRWVDGNHDEVPPKWRALLVQYFGEPKTDLYVQLNGYRFWMNHLPYGEAREDDLRDFQRPEPTQAFDIALCGHVHDAFKINAQGCINVGVDVWNYFPVPIEDIIDLHTEYKFHHKMEKLMEK